MPISRSGFQLTKGKIDALVIVKFSVCLCAVLIKIEKFQSMVMYIKLAVVWLILMIIVMKEYTQDYNSNKCVLVVYSL